MYTEKIRLYPNKTQIKEIDNILNNCRELYNYLLEFNIETYKKTKKGVLGFNLDEPARKFIGEKLPCKIRQATERRLTIAFQRFFKHLCGFPKFKSENRFLSFTTHTVGKDGYRIFPGLNKIQFPRLGKIKAIFTRPILGKPKTMVIKKMKSGKYYVFIFIEDKDIPKPVVQNRKDIVGIDLGISKFITTSEGDYIDSARFLHKNLKKFAKAQRELSRKQKGSKNHEKARIKVAKLYEKVTNCRRDFHFKTARYLVLNYNHIICERFNVKDLLKNNTKLMRRAILDQGFCGFLIILEQMCNKYSSVFTKVDPRYTSQICSSCGRIVKKDLSVRIHKCPHCGLEIDRDVNAAINILHRGQQQLFSGTEIANKNICKFVERVITGLKTGSDA